MEIKLEDIPNLDFREKENVKFTINKFNNIKFVKDKGYTYKKDFKDNFDKLSNFMSFISKKSKMDLGAIFYSSKSQTMTVSNDKEVVVFYSQSLKELFLKVIVYCYYK